ncbi:MAG: hypothetical protein CMJ74_10885 [Planctomycetaceae bacterium]|nr:hypothetical protein [Planctomycetaceae bacterium]|tara:strand:- start:87 stop:341 length:255 start_codon:yes stop_codon:yes gene_type:complete
MPVGEQLALQSHLRPTFFLFTANEIMWQRSCKLSGNLFSQQTPTKVKPFSASRNHLGYLGPAQIKLTRIAKRPLAQYSPHNKIE